jgi:hypothetical protein
MIGEALWAAAGLATAGDHTDSLEPIFAISRSHELVLIEEGSNETGAAAGLPELRLP